MKKLLLVLLPILALTLLSGCASRAKQPKLEDMGLVGAIGFDLAEEGKTSLTLAMPQRPHAFDEKIQLFTSEIDLTHEALVKHSQESDKFLNYTHLRVALFSEEFARDRGLRRAVIDMYRDAEIGDDVYIAVVKGSTKDLMAVRAENQPTVVRYLTDLLEPKSQIAFNPFTTLHGFVNSMTSNVYDPIVPYLEIDGPNIKISNIALFKDDKMVDTLSVDESKILEGLARRKEISALKLRTDEEDEEGNPIYIMLEFIKSKVDMSSNKNIESPELLIKLNFVGTLMGYTGERNLDDVQELSELEVLLDKKIAKDTHDLLEKLQKLKIDPIGMGQHFRMYQRGKWSKEEWRGILAKTEFDVEVHSKFLNTGTID